jgi:hypothetical protein
MTDGQLTIRVMDRREIAIAGDWAAAEGWNPGLDDAACFATVDPNGFYIGELDGAAASTITATTLPSSASTSCGPTCGGAAMGYAPGTRALPMPVRVSLASTAW